MTRTSQIKDVTIKEGRSGAMCFVTVRHNWATERGPALEERQDRTSSITPQMRPVARLPSAPRSRCRKRPASVSGPAIPSYCFATRP